MNPHCNSCGKKFDFFTKEVACSSCGFSFCKSCLKVKDKQKVCNSCFAPKKPAVTTFEPPQALLKRLEQLAVPAQPEDDLTQRLNKLKASHNLGSDLPAQAPSQEELERRLANLKGENWAPAANPVITMYTQRTEDEQVRDLLREFQDLTHLDTHYDPHPTIPELEARLAQLREGHNAQPPVRQEVEEELTDAEAAERIVQEAIARAGLPDSDDETSVTPDTADMDPDMPWCIICNEDATIQCLGCDGDLYCRKCFSQGHEEAPYTQHKFSSYQREEQLKI